MVGPVLCCALPSNDPIRRLVTTRQGPGGRHGTRKCEWNIHRFSCGSLVERALLRREVLERIAQGSSGCDTELGEGSVQVSADGPVGQE